MRSSSRWPLRLMILLVAITDVVLAGDTLCINADNVINALYVDGVNVTSELANRAVARDCDCIPIPASTSTIAVMASNLGQEAGMQACRSGKLVVHDGWHCIDARKVKGKKWYSPSYDAKWWEPAETTTNNYKFSCMNRPYMPCQTIKHAWFWAYEQPNQVVCRMDYCASSCTGCQSAGAGHCDPDKCIYGAVTKNGVVEQDGKGFVTCNQKCRIDVRATDLLVTPDGYIKVTNGATGVSDIWEAKKAGRYLATIDMATCTVTRRNYKNWPDGRSFSWTILNKWKKSTFSPNLRNIIAVDIAVGPGSTSYAPWIDIWKLGVNAVAPFNYKYGVYFSTTFKACLTGVNNREVAFSNVTYPSYL